LSDRTTADMPRFVRELADAMRAEGLCAHVVGGAVRDRLFASGRGMPGAGAGLDIDIHLQAAPEGAVRGLARLLGAALVVMDAGRGHLRLVPRDLSGGGPAWVDLTSGGDLRADLGRRDFTVNAMAVPLEAWLRPDYERSLVDPFGGRGDLDARVLRAVGPTSLADDPVRMMRAVRLSAQFGLSIEDGTREGIRAGAGLVGRVSAERVRDELLALLAGPGAADGVCEMDALGLLDVVLPELAATKGVIQPPEHRWNVFRHSVETVRAAGRLLDGAVRRSDPVLSLAPWRPELDAHFAAEVGDGQTRGTLLKLAALLHDLGKPGARTVEPSGRIRFIGHEKTGAELACGVMRRMRCSRRTVSHVGSMVRHHLRPGQLGQRREAPTGRAVFRYYRDVGEAAVDTLYLNLADYLGARGPLLEGQEWSAYAGMIGDILTGGFETPGESRPFLLLNGCEVMREFGLEPGPKIGALLDSLREAEADGRVRSQEEAIELLRRLI